MEDLMGFEGKGGLLCLSPHGPFLFTFFDVLLYISPYGHNAKKLVILYVVLDFASFMGFT